MPEAPPTGTPAPFLHLPWLLPEASTEDIRPCSPYGVLRRPSSSSYRLAHLLTEPPDSFEPLFPRVDDDGDGGDERGRNGPVRHPRSRSQEGLPGAATALSRVHGFCVGLWRVCITGLTVAHVLF